MKRFLFFSPRAIIELWTERDDWVLLNTTSTFEFTMRLTDNRLAWILGM